jgi:hypothetical protein
LATERIVMNFPFSFVYIKGKKYSIWLGDGDEMDENCSKKDDKILGLYTKDNQTIWLRYPQKKKALMWTLWHEIVHAIDDLVGLNLNEPKTDKLALAIYEVLKDNPYLWKLIWRKDK